MYTNKQHFIRKSLIIWVSFCLGIATTAIAASVYDATIQSRADMMLATIRSNASTLSPADVPAYYSLVRSNIQSLIAVLTTVDKWLTTATDIAIVGTNIATNILPSGTLTLSQNNTTLVATSSNRINVDITKWSITASWDIKNAGECKLDPGYVKNGVGYPIKVNGWDVVPNKGSELVQLNTPDGGKLYTVALYCGAAGRWWGSSQPTKSYFITIAPNTVLPTLSFSRTCNGTPCTTVKPWDMHGANWTTTNTTTMSYFCSSGPVNSTTINQTVATATGVSNNYETYDSLIAGGWIPGTYACAFTLVWPGGITTQSIWLTVAPNTANPDFIGACKVDFDYFAQNGFTESSWISLATTPIIMKDVFLAFVYNNKIYWKNDSSRLRALKVIATGKTIYATCSGWVLTHENGTVLYTTPALSSEPIVPNTVLSNPDLIGACKVDFDYFARNGLKEWGWLNMNTPTHIMKDVFLAFVYNGNIYWRSAPGRSHSLRSIATNEEKVFAMCMDWILTNENQKVLYTTPALK